MPITIHLKAQKTKAGRAATQSAFDVQRLPAQYPLVIPKNQLSVALTFRRPRQATVEGGIHG